MFEIPRIFGAYDTLFKHLGTKQTPSRSDYLLFLRELSAENQGSLNVNELAAVLNVVKLVADSKDSSREQLFVPDQHSRSFMVIES